MFRNFTVAWRSGIIDALIVQNPYMMGDAGVWYALAAAHRVVFPKYVDTGVSVVTKEDINRPQLLPDRAAASPAIGTCVLGSTILVWILLSVFSPYLWTARNIANILRQVSIDAILAFGSLFPSILGCCIGALLVTTLGNGANLLGINSFWQMVIEGLLIAFVVYFDNLQKRRQAGVG